MEKGFIRPIYKLFVVIYCNTIGFLPKVMTNSLYTTVEVKNLLFFSIGGEWGQVLNEFTAPEFLGKRVA